MVGTREGSDHVRGRGDAPGERREALELADEDVPVPLDALVAAADEHERLAADDPPVPFVHVFPGR